MVLCPKCGSENPNYVIYCGKCGSEIPEEARRIAPAEFDKPSGVPPYAADSPPAPTPQEVQRRNELFTPQEGMRKCDWCGAYNKWTANFCVNCGRNPKTGGTSQDQYSEPMLPERKESSWPLVGGIFCILAGIAALAQGGLYLFAESIIVDVPGASGYLCMCGGLDVLFGIGGIAAGVFSFQRRHFMLAIIGAILSMLGIGFLIGGLFGFIGVIALAVSKDEFED